MKNSNYNVGAILIARKKQTINKTTVGTGLVSDCQPKGITLIALIITIIVLLILAGVTINMLTGDNGILKNAQTAAFITRVSAIKEQYELKMMMNMENRENMNYSNWTGGETKGTIKEIIPEIENDLAKILAIEEGELVYTEEVTEEEKQMLGETGIYGESIKIRTAEELRQIATQVQNGRTYQYEKIKLMNDIDLGATWDEEGNLLTGTAWTPIGTYVGTWDVEDTQNSKVFQGIFNGNNYTISGIYIIEENTIGTGLFGYCGKNTIIKNVQLGNGYIKGYQEVGGIVGRTKGTIENCINNRTNINSNYNDVGGIIGRSFGSIKNCKNFADVSGLEWVGGIVGTAGTYISTTNIIQKGGEIINCKNNGKITADSSQNSTAGGIVGGVSQTNIIKCENNGTIYANGARVGGIMGVANHGIILIENCKNYADITASANIGGIQGSSNNVEGDKTKIINCINEGNMTATRDINGTDGWNHLQVAGIAGYTSYTEISACKNKGNITGTYGGWVGGITGALTKYSKISQCINEGYVLGKQTNIGGITGTCEQNSTTSNSYNKGKIESTTSHASGISGIIGWDTPGEVYNCYNIGTVIRIWFS